MYGDECKSLITGGNMTNCVQVDSSNSGKCSLCLPFFIMSGNGCIPGDCLDSCLFCEENKCLVCKSGYVKSQIDNISCSAISEDNSNEITDCK